MTSVGSTERRLLAKAEALLARTRAEHRGQSFEVRLQILEAAASLLGGFDLGSFHRAFGVVPILGLDSLMELGRGVVGAISGTAIPPALALSALAREPLPESRQRTDGAYHTDYRLALHLASRLKPALNSEATVADPACGAGILLAAVAHEVCADDRKRAASWLSHNVFAADLSPDALRGTLIALSTLTDDVQALVAMRARWRVQDSLLVPPEAWADVAPQGFDIVIANPPWEKVKLTRHEHIKAKGGERHYGANYAVFDEASFRTDQERFASYADALQQRYKCLRGGEPDLYMAFTELFLNIAKPGAAVGVLVPAGLIRSQGTESLRRLLASRTASMSVSIIENRTQFFPIDTRFKFLALHLTIKPEGDAPPRPLEVSYGRCDGGRVETEDHLLIDQRVLAEVRPDLTIPEVRGQDEWRMFTTMAQHGVDWSKPSCPWYPEFMRELDMTRDRKAFRSVPGSRMLPLVEGRMVQQHRFGAKVYVEGTGRSAVWDPVSPGCSQLRPQFWVDDRELPKRAHARSQVLRVGFCDITGQTNERSLMAAAIPPGVVCGNKVPTVLFPNDPSEDRLFLWLAIVNSLPFDWAMRRIITTTVNYFLFLSMPLPPIAPDSLPGRKLIESARGLSELDRSGSGRPVLWRMAEHRANADLLVLNGYGLGYEDLELMLEDFPLLDRGQPPLAGEERSTITRDFLLHRARERYRLSTKPWLDRVEAARELGAVPYIPSQVAANMERNVREEAYIVQHALSPS